MQALETPKQVHCVAIGPTQERRSAAAVLQKRYEAKRFGVGHHRVMQQNAQLVRRARDCTPYLERERREASVGL